MAPILKLMLALATVLGVAVTTVKSQNKICDDNFEKDQLQTDAQEALNAIRSTYTLPVSHEPAKKGQHVFNNNLIKFHRSVLEKLLKDLGGYKHMENLKKDLLFSLNNEQQKAISTEMVVHLSSKDEYKDYNSVVYGAYVEKLRGTLVEYLKADTSYKDDQRNRFKTEVEIITNQMVNRDVYVDPMACDYWLKENQRETQKKKQQFKDIRNALRNMFQNIVQDFKKVSEKIKELYKSGKWNSR